MTALLAKILARLTGAYNKSPDGLIGRLFYIFAWALNGLDEALDTIAIWRDIEQARGTTLDRMGANFGVTRGSASDTFYRMMIKVKITAMLSGGDVDTVISAAATLLEVDASTVDLVEQYPAKVWLYVNYDDLSEDAQNEIDAIADLLKRIVSAGIGLRLFLKTYRTLTGSVYPVSAMYLAPELEAVPASREGAIIGGSYPAEGGFTQTYLTIRAQN